MKKSRLSISKQHEFIEHFVAGASFNSGDYDSVETFGVEGTHFFTPQIALNITWSTFFASQTEDADSFSIDVIARF